MSRDSSDKKKYPPARSAVVLAWLLLAAAAGVFLAGNIRQGSSGIFLAAAGAAMVLVAPNRAVPWRYWWLAGGILAAALLGMLPQAWFYAPPWRVGLEEYTGLPPLPHVSLAPRETMFWWVMMLGAVATGLFMLGHPVRSGAKVWLALLGVVVCAGYAAVAIYAKATGWEYLFFDQEGWSPPDFGFFPNRNHTAALLVTGSILGLGVVRQAWTARWPFVWLTAGASMGVCIYALLFESASRGGIVFLLVGVVVWVAMLGRENRSGPLLVSSLVIGSALILIFLGSEGLARDRILEMLGFAPGKEVVVVEGDAIEKPPPTVFSDFRALIFADTLRMVREYPITGTGLGTYAYVYPFHARASMGEATALHPESDWLMVAAECGVPCVLLCVALLVVLVRGILPMRHSPTWPLRWGCAAAVIAVLLHGLVDVPVHRVELGWWILVLAGLAFGVPAPTGTERNGAWVAQRLLFGVCGALFLILGITMVRAEWFGVPPFPPYRHTVAVDQMRQLAEAGRNTEAKNLARSEIPLSPMSRGLYRELGYREMREGKDPVVADAAFDAERALNPVSAQIPLDQGRLWLRDDITRTAELWGEALRKHMALEKAGAYANSVEFYSRMLSEARGYPGLVELLGANARLSPELWLVWVSRAPKGAIEKAALEETAFLEMLDHDGRRAFLNAWWARGDRGALEEFLQGHPDWEEAAWPVRVRAMVAAKDHRAALEAVRDRYGIDLSMPIAPEEVLAGERPPADLAEQVAYHLARNNPVSARRMVNESAEAREAEGLRLRCLLMVRAGDWTEAWKAMEAYLRQTGRSQLP
jgi:O-antigen ligase